tara:strand:+ start:771 stop:986 length:216 start_codon:yes stop_codon:yes gene_type:complete
MKGDKGRTMGDKIKLALEWLEDNNVSAYESDGSIYISIPSGNEDYSGNDFQISTAEVFHLAELQSEVVVCG